MTFRDLWHAAEGYACALERVGVTPGQIVAIGLPRSPQLVAAVLGALRAGAAFLCLDRRAPAPRREFILSDCDAAAVVVAPGAEALACGRPCVVRPDEVGPGRRGTGSAAPSPDDPAYVVYTSGSTGEPKGVLIPHAALVNHMQWMQERFPLTGSDLLLQRTPLTFDASVWELFAPLLGGSRLVLAPDETVFDPVRLGRVVREHGITTLQVVPSILGALLTSGELRRCGSLQRIFSGGEPLTAELRDDVLAASAAELVNLYGPTETPIDATFHVCDREDHREFVPIGRPVANALLHVLDDHGATVPFGGVGELHIGGAPVGSGYLNRPALTAERFVNSPVDEGGRLFRTGDRVRLLATGEVEFLGRLDDQVKLRGFRIELGEVESVLARHPAVADVAAVVQEHRSDDLRLVAFVVPCGAARGGPDSSAELHAWLRARLPGHLVPSTVAMVDSLPRTPHGKIDRAALRVAEVGRTPDPDAAAPRDDLERAVCRCFEEVLGAPVAGIDGDFFHLGGHSLLVLPARERLRALTSRRVEVVDFFEFPTPRRLAAVLRSRPTEAPRTPGA